MPAEEIGDAHTLASAHPERASHFSSTDPIENRSPGLNLFQKTFLTVFFAALSTAATASSFAAS